MTHDTLAGPELDFLVVSLGSTGDTHPVLAIASELRNRGHRVRFVGNSRFASLAKSLHLDFIKFEQPPPSLGSQQPSPPAQRLGAALTRYWLYQAASRTGLRKRSYVGAMRWLYELIAQQPTRRRTIVVARDNSFGARIAQEKLGVPLVSIQLQPAGFRSVYDAPGLPLPGFAGPAMRKFTWSLIDAGIGCTITPALNRFRSELGLAPARRPLRKWIYSPDLVVALFPEWFGAPQPDWPPNSHAVGFALLDESAHQAMPRECEEFLEHGEPPLVFTRGSHARSPAAYSFFETSIEVARLLGRRAILLADERDWAPMTLPVNVGYFGYVPLSMLLPRAAGLVHHGGLGTTAHAIAAGIPQIAVPLSDDQPDNAARVERLGVGLRISPGDYKAALVAGRLQSLLNSDQVQTTCHRLAASFASQSPLGDACRLIENWAATLGSQ